MQLALPEKKLAFSMNKYLKVIKRLVIEIVAFFVEAFLDSKNREKKSIKNLSCLFKLVLYCTVH